MKRGSQGGRTVTKEIPLTQGMFTIVSDKYYNELIKVKWCATKAGKFYAVRTVRGVDGKFHNVYMHRVIYEMEHGPIPAGKFIDHIDRNSLNNSIENLRAVNNNQSGCNRGKRADNISGYIGVYWVTLRNKWLAQIWIDGKHHFIGRYATAKEAARAYDQAAVERGEVCELNFPEEHPEFMAMVEVEGVGT
jgi:hypothetical protein